MSEIEKWLAEAQEEKRQLFARLAAQPVSDVWGVVGPSGAAGSTIGRSEDWTVSCELAAWRLSNGAVQRQPLRLQRKATLDEVQRFQELLLAERIIHVQARVVAVGLEGGAQALLEKVVAVDVDDAALAEIRDELRQPVTIDDDRFGTFTLDRRLDWYCGNANWGRKTIELNLPANDPADARAALQAAHKLWRDQPEWDRRVSEFAVQELLPIKNESWLNEDEGELPYTAKQFQAKMSLTSITIDSGGAFEFWHDDGDLFWGHSIQVSGNLADGPTDADIPG
jgi:hypothetical protein